MLWRRLEYLLPWRRRAAERDMQEELSSIRAMAAPGELGNLARGIDAMADSRNSGDRDVNSYPRKSAPGKAGWEQGTPRV